LIAAISPQGRNPRCHPAHLPSLDEAFVNAAKTDGASALPDDCGNKVLVDLSAQDALDNLHGFLVRIPKAI
jgi:hypothetical protein